MTSKDKLIEFLKSAGILYIDSGNIVEVARLLYIFDKDGYYMYQESY